MRLFNRLLFSLLVILLPLTMAAQIDKKINANYKDATLLEILQSVSKESKNSVLFKVEEVAKEQKRISISLKNASVKEVVEAAIKGLGFTATVRDGIIVIEPSKQNVGNRNVAEQSKTVISGTITDLSGKPLPGVAIMVKGTTKGTTSDDDGKYSLDVPATGTVQYVMLGMTTREMPIRGSRIQDIIMEEEAFNVGEIVVTGFFDRKKEGFSGAITQIGKEDLKKVYTGNIFTTISTLDSGFKIEENNIEGSNPNAITDFTIRGKGSFQSGSTSPIFILDGFEVSPQKIFDMDVNRVQSITLLKDASATILYGSKAANGVIVIETIAPAKGKIRVTYDFKPTVAVADLSGYDLMNAREKLQYELEAGLYTAKISPGYEESGRRDQYNLDLAYNQKYKNIVEGVDTYWLSQPVRTAFSHAHSIFVEGGDDNVRYGIDGNFNANNGVMKGSGRDRLGVGFSLIYRIKEKITIKNYASFSNTTPFNSPYGSYATYARTNPYERIYDEYGKLIPKLSNGDSNPLYDAMLPNRNNGEIQEFREQLNIDWMLSRGFRVRGQLGIVKGVDSYEVYKSPFSSEFLSSVYNPDTQMNEYLPIAKRGQLSLTNGSSLNVSGNVTINYNKVFAEKHLFYLGAGFEMLESTQKNHGFSVTGFPDDKYSDPAFAIQYLENSKPISSEHTMRSLGALMTANYIYDNRLFADFSGRIDGSSKFGSDRRYAPFWSLGIGWNIHNEEFFKDNNKVSMLVLRATYGVVGNQEFSSYQARTTFKYNTDRVYNQFITASLMGYGNPDLKWQNQYQLNTGVDLGLLQDRVRLQFNYYRKKTEGMLTNITVAPSLGFPSNTYVSNLGVIQNNGLELNSNVVVIRKPKEQIEWSLMLQASSNKNKLVEISNALKTINEQNNNDRTTPLAVYEEGESMTAIKAVQSLGIDPVTGREIFVKKMTGAITYDWDAADKIVCGDSEPVVFGNLGSNLYYKGWNLNLQFRYRLGADYYNSTLAQRVEGADPKYNADRRVLNDRWKEEGQHALYKNIKEYTSTYVSTRFVQKEQFLQLGSLSLSYDFSKSMISKLKLNSLRASFYMNDLFRLSTIKNERGTEYPFQMSYIFGLNLGF